nr:MAG TPA: hypothetical protein [Caudoviricetes sp.]
MVIFGWACTFLGAAALARSIVRLVDKLGGHHG